MRVLSSLAITLAMSLALIACSKTLAVRGTSETGDESFSGSATGYMDGAGTL